MTQVTPSRLRLFPVFIPFLLFFLLSALLLIMFQSNSVQADVTGPGAVTFTKTDTLVNDVLGDGDANPGDTLRYDLTINNTTGSDLTNVVLTDVIDSNLTWNGVWQSTAIALNGEFTTTADTPVVITLTGNDPDGDTLAFSVLTPPTDGSLGTITPQTATTANVTYTPNMGHPGSDNFTFQVMDDDGNTDSATISITVVNSDIAVSKIVNAPVLFEGGRITYTVSAGNQGTSPLTNIVISDVLPANLTYFGHSTSAGSYNSGTGNWSILNIGVGVTHTLAIYLDINAGTAGQTITNTAEFVSMDQADANPANNSQSVNFTVQPLVDIVTVKEVDNSSPLEGGTIVYTVYAGNNGPNNATGVQITDVLPSGVTYVSSDPPGYMPPVWDIGSLNAFVTETLRITATVNSMTAGNTYTNTATVTAVNETDSDSSNDSDQASITVNLPPTAVDDNPGGMDAYQVTSGATLNVPDGLTDPVERNDIVGVPAATISSFGGGDIGGAVTDNAAGATVSPIPGYTNGSLTVNADGSFGFTPPTTPTAFGGNFRFDYRLTNAVGISDATVTVQVQSGPTAVNDPNGGLPGNSIPGGHPYHFARNSSNNTISGMNRLLQNDNLGVPPASLLSFGGGDIGGTVMTNPAGSTAMSGGHTLTVDATGVVTYTPAMNFSGLFTFTYRLNNIAGSDDALVTMAVGNRPTCADDAYDSTGNVGIQVPAGGVMLNDTGDQVSVTAVQGNPANVGNPTATSVMGGSVTLNSNGSFAYMPPAGYVGPDTFTYDIDNGFNTPSQCTVTVTVSDMIWFIDSAAAGGGNGRLNTPFNTLGAFNAINSGPPPNAQPGSTIFLHTGAGNYTGGLILRDGQILIGQGATASIAAIAGITLPPNSNPLPLTSGTRPVITNGSGTGIGLGSGNTIRGLNIGNTSTSSGAGMSGSMVGSLTISELSISGQGRAVDINGGTLNVTLDSVAVTAATNGGFSLQNTMGTTTISALNLTTTGGTGFLANNAGTINVTGATNSVGSTSGTAVNLTNTTIGASGITLQSVSSSGADTGITLNNTGTGDFTVTGTGTTDSSGGTLQTLNDHGIELINAQDVSISNMDLTNATTTQDVAVNTPTCDDESGGTNTGCNAPVQMVNATNISLTNLTINGSVQHGINGNNVNGLSISNTDVSNIGDDQLENGMHIINLLGTVSFNNLNIDGSETRNVLIENNTGTANITVTNSTFNNTTPANGEDGFHLIAGNSANVTLNVSDSSFIHNRGPQLKAHAEDGSTVNATITDNTFDGQPAIGGNTGVDLAVRDNANLIFNVSGTNLGDQIFQPIRGQVINIFAIGSGTASGRINRNDINGSDQASGVRVVSEVTTSGNPSVVVEIDGNDIDGVSGTGNAGINIISRDGAGGATGTADVQATINNNDVTITGADSIIQAYLNDGNTMCLDVTNNSAAGAATSPFAGFGSTHYLGNPVPGGGSGPGTMTYDGYIAGNLGGTWNANGNSPTLAAGIVGEAFVDGTQPTNGTCTTVTSTPVANLNKHGAAGATTLAKANLNKHAVAGPTTTNGGPALIQTLGTIPAGKSMTISFDATINDPFPDMVSEVSNQGQITADGALNMLSDDPDTPAPNDSTVTPVIIIPSFDFTKQDALLVDADNNNVASPGDTIQYTVNFINTGDNAIDNIVFTDTVDVNSTLDIDSISISSGPANISNRPANPQGGSPGFSIIWIPPLPAGEGITITFNVDVNDPFPAGVSQISNQMFVNADNIPSTPSDDPDTPTAMDPTITPIDATRVVYLPVVLNNYASLPDLVVQSITPTTNDVTVVIQNNGTMPVTEAFWVDAYFNPPTPPTAVNETINTMNITGIVWGVTSSALPLDPGESLTLTVGSPYYNDTMSKFNGTVPSGTLYVQVDSANIATTYGAILETHEATGGIYNNIASTIVSRPVSFLGETSEGNSRQSSMPKLP